jgi:drug/metabolite transporter (DMT)-like permease
LDVTLLVVLGLLWGSAYVFIKEGIELGASPLLFASVRYGLSAAGFAAVAVARRESLPSGRALAVSAAIGGILFIGLYGGFLYWGEQYTTGGYAAVLSTTGPILTVVVAFFLLPAERFGRLSLMGLAIGFVGVVVLVAPELTGGVGTSWLGPLFIVAAFVASAFGTVLLRRLGGGRQGLWQIGSQFAVGGLLLGVAALVLPFPEVLPSVPGVWASLASLVVFSSVIGYFIYFTLHHRVGPVRANIVAYLIPLAGIGIGSGFFGEAISLWEVVGFLVVILGVTLIILESSRSRR